MSSRTQRFLGRLAWRLRSEAGIALPVSVIVLSLVMLLGAVAVGQAVSASSGTHRDSNSKRALQAANAGVETALWRMNALAEQTTDPSETTCLIRGADLSLQLVGVSTDGWCPAGAAEDIGGGESYWYRVSGPQAGLDFDGLHSTIDRRIVSTGSAGGVTRRVVTDVSALNLSGFFSDYVAFSRDDMTLSNQGDIGSPEVQGNARSNGSIFLEHPNSRVYGNATPGPGEAVLTGEGGGSASTRVDGSTAPAENPLELPQAIVPPAADVDGETCDVSLALLYTCPSHAYDPSSRRLALDGDTVVLRGNTFVFCSITMRNNSRLKLAPTDLLEPVRIYIDAPENCEDSTGNPPLRSLSFENQPRISWALDLLGISLSDLTHPVLQMYVVGGDPPTEIHYENNNTSEENVPMTLYAPNSNVTFENYARLTGGVIASKLTMSNNTSIAPTSASIGEVITGVTPIYHEKRFAECTAQAVAGSAPDEGC